MQTRRRALDGKIVAVTRPKERADALARELSRLGARVVYAPLVKIAPPRSRRALDSALRAEFDAAAFASATAVDAYFSRARALGVKPKKPARVLAVGPATAAALAARGWKARIAREQTGAGLARAFGSARGLRVLVPQAEDGRPELTALLRKAGARVTRADAYRAVPDPRGRAALRAALAKRLDAACLASPSAARALLAAAGARVRPVPCAAIGPTTAAELRKLGFTRVRVAARPSPAALARALRIFFNGSDGSRPARRTRRAR